MKIYIVTAYRWGWTNNSNYTVLVTTNRHHAVSAAEAECSSRGGKYGCEVLAHVDGSDDAPERVAYFPSSYSEEEPHANWRLEAADSIGIEVLSEIESGKSLSMEWLADKVKRASEIAKIMCGGAALAEARK